jgi:hypothetical protein
MAIEDKMKLGTRFQLNTTPDEIIRLQDTTDYASEGIDPTDVIGSFVIKSPLGTVFHSTVLPSFDIDNNVQDYIDTIKLPEDVNSVVLKGIYEVSYTIRVSGGVQPGDYETTFLYNYCYETIVPDVDVTVNLITSTFTSTDNTSYPVELTSNTRTHTIHPPSGLDPIVWPVKTAATQVLTYSEITTKTWTGKIVNILELTFPALGTSSEHIIDVTITGNNEKDIVDDINICSLQCNMIALSDRYNEALGTNSVNAVRIFNQQVAPALLAESNYRGSIECGNFDLAEQYYQDVLKYTKSNKDCQCDANNEPTLISAVGGGISLQIQDEGSDLPIQDTLNFIGTAVTAVDNPTTGATDVTINNGGHIIEDEGTPLANQPTLNFIGPDVTVTDNVGDNTTDVTISSPSGNAHVIEEEGTPLPAQPALNFIGDNVTATNNAGNSATDITIDAVAESGWTEVNNVAVLANTQSTPWLGIVINAVTLSIRYKIIGKTVFLQYFSNSQIIITTTGNISISLSILGMAAIFPSGFAFPQQFAPATLRTRNFLNPSQAMLCSISGDKIQFDSLQFTGAFTNLQFALEGQISFDIN